VSSHSSSAASVEDEIRADLRFALTIPDGVGGVIGGWLAQALRARPNMLQIEEPGADVAAEAIAGGVVVSTVNLAEVFSRSADRGADPAKLAAKLTQSGLLDGAITVEPFTATDAIDVAHLRPLTRDAGSRLATGRASLWRGGWAPRC
jgi:PIN domain nuclease of toxin-antitoxin system